MAGRDQNRVGNGPPARPTLETPRDTGSGGRTRQGPRGERWRGSGAKSATKVRRVLVMTGTEQGAPFYVALQMRPGEEHPLVTVSGKTYGAQLVLGAHGGRFDKERTVWVFPNETDASAAVEECARLFRMRAARGGAA
jgi:hypothetical protein